MELTTSMQIDRIVTSRLARFASLTVALAASAAALASEVPDLVTFMPGTPARAGEVNGNFSALRTAVNDNHARLTAAEASLKSQTTRLEQLETSDDSARLTAAEASLQNQSARLEQLETSDGPARLTAAEASLQSHSARLDGLGASLSGLQNDLTELEAATQSAADELAAVSAELRAPGVISISPAAFQLSSESDASCIHQLSISNAAIFAGSPGTNCMAAAPVSLPQGVTITAVRCTYADLSTDGILKLIRLRSLGLASPAVIDHWAYTNSELPSADHGGYEVVSLQPWSAAAVDNSTQSYFVMIYTQPPISSLGCRVHFERPQ